MIGIVGTKSGAGDGATRRRAEIAAGRMDVRATGGRHAGGRARTNAHRTRVTAVEASGSRRTDRSPSAAIARRTAKPNTAARDLPDGVEEATAIRAIEAADTGRVRRAAARIAAARGGPAMSRLSERSERAPPPATTASSTGAAPRNEERGDGTTGRAARNIELRPGAATTTLA